MKGWLVGPFLGGSPYTCPSRTAAAAEVLPEDGRYRADIDSEQSMTLGGGWEIPFMKFDIIFNFVDRHGEQWRLTRRYDMLSAADISEINDFAGLFGITVGRAEEIKELMRRIATAKLRIDIHNGDLSGGRTTVTVRRLYRRRSSGCDDKADVWTRNFNFMVLREQRREMAWG